MNQKKKWMAISVTTKEGLQKCLKNQNVLFCIESPLYEEVENLGAWPLLMQDYQMEEHPEVRLILAKKIRGETSFDEQRYEAYYYPLAER